MGAFLIAALLFAHQDPRIDATLSASTARVGDAVVVQIVVESDEHAPSRVDTPALAPELEILRTQDFSETQLSFPGGRLRRFRREIVIVAHAPGSYVIPSAQIEIGGRQYRTPELHLVVTGVDAGRGESIGRARLRVGFVPDTVFVGQQTLLRAEALIPEARRPRRARAPSFEPPQAVGFWTQDLPQGRQSTLRLVGGDVFEVHSYTRAYFALAAGPRALPPTSVVYESRVDWLSGTRLERMISDSVRLEVLPLPAEGRPAGFRGAVGKFTLAADLEPTSVRAGEAATLVITIRGEGNVKGLPPPELPELGTVDVLRAGDDAETWVSDGVLHGTRRFRWLLVPTTVEDVRIEPVALTYFDPFERRYEVVHAEQLHLAVLPAAVPSGEAPLAELQLRRNGSPDRLGWVRSPLFLSLNLLPLFAVLGIAFAKRRAKRPRLRRSDRDLLRSWRLRTATAQPTADAVRRAFIRTLADALGTPAGEIGDDAGLVRSLRARGAAETDIDRARTVLRRLDEIRFGGEASWDAIERATIMRDATSVLESVVRGPGRTRGTGTAATSGMLLIVLAAGAAGLVASGVEFDRGVAAYDAGDLAAAVSHFRAHVRSSPRDAAAWYNLGAVHDARAERGAAVAAWLRSLRLQPRDAEIRTLLRDAGAGTALRAVSPPLRLSRDEAVLLGSGLWLALNGGLLLIVVGRRSRGATIAAAAVVLLAVHAASAWWHEHALGRVVVAIGEPTVLRSAPALRASDVDTAAVGAVLSIVEQREAWLRVAGARSEGWVEARDVARP
jgi:tetratricopeptide (TPR) repeat protein